MADHKRRAQSGFILPLLGTERQASELPACTGNSLAWSSVSYERVTDLDLDAASEEAAALCEKRLQSALLDDPVATLERLCGKAPGDEQVQGRAPGDGLVERLNALESLVLSAKEREATKSQSKRERIARLESALGVG